MSPRQALNSLVTRFIALGWILLIIGSVASYWRITNFLRQDLEQSISASQLTLAGYVAGNVQSRLDDRRRVLDSLAAALPRQLLDDPQALRAWLADHPTLQTLFPGGLLVADLNGRPLARVVSGKFVPGTRPMAEDPGFQDAREGRSGLGQPSTDTASGQPVLPIAAPVRDSAGTVVAALIGIADLAAIGSLDPARPAPAPGLAHIVVASSRDRLIVASTAPGQVLLPLPPPGTGTLHERAVTGSHGAGRAIDPQGIEELVATAPVGETGWYAAVHMPAREALVSVERTKTFLIQLSLTRALLVLVLVGVLIAWMLRPLYRAAGLAERMTQGDLPLAPLPVEHQDEVGHLTASFNRLLQKLVAQQTELGRMAYRDALTGLPNRKLLIDRMAQARARAGRNQTRIAVLFLDLDGFKAINDTQGHGAGDEALQLIARRLSDLVRQADTLARLGGDEFVLLAPDIENPPDAALRALAEKCIAAVALPIRLGDVEHTLDVSIGIALSDGSDDPEAMLASADKAMYVAKRKGPGGYAMAGEPAPQAPRSA